MLYIGGGGDPFLISEELAQLASALVLIGVTQSPVMKSAQMSTFTSATMLPRRVVREPRDLRHVEVGSVVEVAAGRRQDASIRNADLRNVEACPAFGGYGGGN